jgi:predicted Ser/Thr protein kinase
MVGEVVAGRFEIEELVGTGGMSSVYRAHDRLLERKVALKILHDTFGADEGTIERFRREARAAAQLSHPGIVTVIDRGEDAGRQFIVFEYVEGENLKKLIERSGRLPVRQALELTIETGRALAFAHQHGLVHRDVKPQNVLLNGDGEPKVTDFGIARAVDLASFTESGAVLGTSYYISPEQASGEQVHAQSDVYSLGVVLFELLTGEVPFEGDNFVAVAAQHVNEPPPNVLERRPDVPVRVAHAVERALAKEPASRFDSMDDFVAELESCRAELGADPDRDSTAILRAEPLPPPPRPRRSARRRAAWPVVLLVLGVLALGAVAAVALLAGSDSPGPAAEPAPQPVRLAGVASYDPEGDDKVEHPEAVGRATDGDPNTYWYTATYEDFDALKSGVGLVLDARGGKPSEITVDTSTPGFTARIDAGARPTGPFRSVSDEQRVGGSATFELNDTDARYFVVWITGMPQGSRAEITEVKAR